MVHTLLPVMLILPILIQVDDYDFYLVKLNENGNIEWQKKYSLSQESIIRGKSIYSKIFHSEFQKFFFKLNDGYLITIPLRDENKSENLELLFIKVDSTGSVQWQKNVQTDISEHEFKAKKLKIYLVEQDENNNISVLGRFKKVWLLKFDNDGSLLINRTYTPNIYFIAKTSDNYYTFLSVFEPSHNTYAALSIPACEHYSKGDNYNYQIISQDNEIPVSDILAVHEYEFDGFRDYGDRVKGKITNILTCNPYYYDEQTYLVIDDIDDNDITSTLLCSNMHKLEVKNESHLGLGSGVVISNPSGIDCGDNCSNWYEHGTVITLIAVPDENSSFLGWNGDCESCGINTECTITVDKFNELCTANFYDKQITSLLQWKRNTPIDYEFAYVFNATFFRFTLYRSTLFVDKSDNPYMLVSGSINKKEAVNGLIKFDKSGNIINSVFFKDKKNRYVYVRDIHELKDGNFLLLGEYSKSEIDESKNKTAVVLVKVDPQLNILWSKRLYIPTYRKDGFYYGYFSSVNTEDNSIVIVGYNEYDRATLTKIDNEGNTLWSKSIEIGGYYLEEFQRTNDEGFVLLVKDYKDDKTFLRLFKLDKYGNTEWNKEIIFGDYLIRGLYLRVLNDGYIIVAEHSSNIILLKIDKNGNILWEKEISTDEGTEFTGIKPVNVFVSAENISIAANLTYGISKFYGNSKRQPVLIELDHHGNLIRCLDRELGRIGEIITITKTHDGGFISLEENHAGVFLKKLNENFEIVRCEYSYPSNKVKEIPVDTYIQEQVIDKPNERNEIIESEEIELEKVVAGIKFPLECGENVEDEGDEYFFGTGEVYYQLNVYPIGDGYGYIKGKPGNIYCGHLEDLIENEVCSIFLKEGTKVKLEAKQSKKSESIFVGWEDDCKVCGLEKKCTIILDSEKYCSARFEGF